MLAQFQSLYPQGSIISELIQIHHNKYIVRVKVRIEGVTRVTGMAAAETIEVAEDRARERALMVLKTTSTQNNPANSSPQGQEVTVKSRNAESTETSYKSNAKQLTAKKPTAETVNQTLTQEEPITIFEPNHSSPTFTTAKATDESTPPIANQPLIQDEPTAVPASSHPGSKFTVQREIPTQAINQSDLDSESTTTSNPQFQFDSPLADNVVSTSDKLVEQSQLPLMSSTNVQSFMSPEKPSEEEQEVTASIKKKSTTTSRKKKKTEPKDVTQPTSLLDPIAQIDVEMRRLGWTREQGREHLIQTYGKRARSLLTDEQLLEFLEYLKSQPTPIDPLDPGF